jgi:HEPN domain-containing protein
MVEENGELEVHPTSGRTFGDYPNYNGLEELLNILRQCFHGAEDFKQAIRFVEAHYPKSQIDHHFNDGRCKIPKHFSYTSRSNVRGCPLIAV